MNMREMINNNPEMIILDNDEYNLHDIINLLDDWVLVKIKDCIINHKDKIQLRLLGEDNFNRVYNKYLDNKNMFDYYMNNIDINCKRDYRKHSIELFNPIINNINSTIPNETCLVEISDYLSSKENWISLPDNYIIEFYGGSIKLGDLYKQFKGKDNFINLIKYVRKEVGIVNNE